MFYLSFSFVTRHYTNKAKEFAKGDVKVEQDYLDSLSNEKVWLGNYTLKQCREMEISLGLDLKGGMNVILEVSVPDVIKALADNKPDEAFNNALATAAKQAVNSQDDVITLFIREYHKIAPDAKLSELFATQQLKDKVNQKSSDAEVEKVLREEVKAAVKTHTTCFVHVSTALVWFNPTSKVWKTKWDVSWWNFRVSKSRNV
ncbi:secD/SecF GG Motif family protein [Bacteroides fragilis str. 3397 T10]|nr:secD/SecF GG Motif family protein [Bacteroides fragilis str. 3397 T10]